MRGLELVLSSVKVVGSGVLLKGATIGPGFFPVVKEEKKKLKPEDDQYIAKYKEYKELKDMRAEFEKEVDKVKREDWDKYTKGPESPHKKGLELKEIYNPAPNCEFSSHEVKLLSKAEVKVSRLESESNTLQALNEKNKEIFITLRELYNSLDTVRDISN